MIENGGIKIDFCKLSGEEIVSELISNKQCRVLNIPQNVEIVDICFHPEKRCCPYDLISNLDQFFFENKNVSVAVTFLDDLDTEIQSTYLEQCDVIGTPADATKVFFCFADKHNQYHNCLF